MLSCLMSIGVHIYSSVFYQVFYYWKGFLIVLLYSNFLMKMFVSAKKIDGIFVYNRKAINIGHLKNKN